MSQPTGPGVPPDFQPPSHDGGYGGNLQNYGQQGYQGLGYVPTPPPWRPQPSAAPAAPLAPAAVQALPSSPPQRPAVVGLAATLAATASLQWVCVLSVCWLVATAGAAQLGTTGVDGGLYHLLNRFNYRMLDGLAWPLYLFPVASFVLSFLVLARREWARIAFTVTGAAALVWSAWWLRTDLEWWLIPASYIALAVLVLWTPEATRWYRWNRQSHPAGQLY